MAQVRAWSERLGAAYWDAYRETIGGVALWPVDEAQQKSLLDMFLLEKALYEIEYERSVKCVKKTPQSYRVQRLDGTTRLVKQDLIIELRQVS